MSGGGDDIVLLSTADWGNPFWTNKQHVALELSRQGNRVFFIDSLGLRRPTGTRSDMSRILRRVINGVRFPRKINENLWVWSPLVIPLQKYGVVRSVNKWILSVFVAAFTRMLGFRAPVLWTYNPMTLDLFSVSPCTRVIYHCVDEIKAQPGMPAEELESAERKLLARADYVFVTSEKLYHSRKQVNSNTFLFSNVADFDHFSKARTAAITAPADIAEVKRPVIGFVGAISAYKVDFDLLSFVARSRPEWSIVLIGKIGEGEPGTDVSKLNRENIYFLGPKPYQDLPAYMSYFDVAVIPAAINDYTNAMFPMKFFEYLAVGKRVVATNIDSLKNYGHYLLLSDGYSDFLDNIEKVLAEGNDVGLEERLALAKENTYRSRTEKMLAIVNGWTGESCP